MLATYDWVIGKLRQAGITTGADSVRFLLNLRTPDGQPIPTNVKSIIGMAFAGVERGRYPNLETAIINNSRADQSLLGSIQGTVAPLGSAAPPVAQTVPPATDPVYVGGSGSGQQTVASLVPAGTPVVPITATKIAPPPAPGATPPPARASDLETIALLTAQRKAAAEAQAAASLRTAQQVAALEAQAAARQYTAAELQAIVAKLGRGQTLTAQERAAIGSTATRPVNVAETGPADAIPAPPTDAPAGMSYIPDPTTGAPMPVGVAPTGPADILPGFPGSGIELPGKVETPPPAPTPTVVEYVKDPVTGKNILDPLGRPIPVAPGGNLSDIQTYLNALAQAGSNLQQAGIANTFAVRKATTAGEQAQRKASREMYSSRQMALNALAQRGITGAPGLSVAAQRSAQAAPLANKLEALRTMQDTVDSANILLAQEQERKRQAETSALSDLTRASLIENKLKG